MVYYEKNNFFADILAFLASAASAQIIRKGHPKDNNNNPNHGRGNAEISYTQPQHASDVLVIKTRAGNNFSFDQSKTAIIPAHFYFKIGNLPFARARLDLMYADQNKKWQ